TYQKYPALSEDIIKRAGKILAIQLADQEGYDGEKLAEQANIYKRFLFEKKQRELGKEIGQYNSEWKENIEQIKKNTKQFERFKEIARQQLQRNGYDIHLTIDKKLYDKMQKVTQNYDNYAPDTKNDSEQ